MCNINVTARGRSGQAAWGGGAAPEPCGQDGLAGTPWSLRAADGPAGRPALELYDAGALMDVVVERSPALRLAPADILRGARAGSWAGRRSAVAWGHLPPSGDVTVSFTRGRLRRRAVPAAVARLADRFWVARADGRFDGVLVTHHVARERRRLRRARR
jgi:hypothetical protein